MVLLSLVQRTPSSTAHNAAILITSPWPSSNDLSANRIAILQSDQPIILYQVAYPSIHVSEPTSLGPRKPGGSRWIWYYRYQVSQETAVESMDNPSNHLWFRGWCSSHIWIWSEHQRAGAFVAKHKNRHVDLPRMGPYSNNRPMASSTITALGIYLVNVFLIVVLFSCSCYLCRSAPS